MKTNAFFNRLAWSVRDLVAGMFICVLLPVIAAAQAPEIDGQYSAVFKGHIHYTDRTPAAVQVAEPSTVTVTTQGDTIIIDVGQIGGVMSATRFRGKVGNSTFTAMHTSPTMPDQARVLWGRIERGKVDGHLLYPRVADGLVPGYTQLRFQGKIVSGNTNQPAADGRRLKPGVSNRPPSVSVPRPAGTSPTKKPKKELKPARPTGNSVVRGTITGDIGVVYNVQLIDENENTLQTTQLDSNGRFRFDNVAAGQYWIYVNDLRAEAYIRTTSGSMPIDADGSSSYRINFDVDN